MMKKLIKKVFNKDSKVYKCLSKIYNSMKYKYCSFSYRTRKHKFIKKKIKKDFKVNFKYNLDLDNPKRFNEKLNWLKLFWYDENAILAANKFTSRKYVQDKGLSHILPELYGHYETFIQIDFNLLPNEFIIKTSHDSGGVYLVNDKQEMNFSSIKRDINKRLKKDYSLLSSEWPYKYGVRNIIVEELLYPDQNSNLIDYKFMCFNGVPHYIYVSTIIDDVKLSSYYDLDWNKLNIQWNHYETLNLIRPNELEDMLKYAKILSADFPQARVDFYITTKGIRFSEITFFHYAGFGKFSSEEYDLMFGDLIILPNNKANPWK